jgi:hypothetical protein
LPAAPETRVASNAPGAQASFSEPQTIGTLRYTPAMSTPFPMTATGRGLY